MNNPLTFIDPDGLDAISQQDGQKIANTAAAQLGTPYKFGGRELGPNGGADCGGITWSIYKLAGFEYEHVGADRAKFTDSLSEGKVNDNRFVEITDTTKLQEGDIGLFNGHMIIYAGKTNGVDEVYSTHGEPGKEGKPYKKDTLSNWNKWKPGEDVKWFRYNTTEKKSETDGNNK